MLSYRTIIFLICCFFIRVLTAQENEFYLLDELSNLEKLVEKGKFHDGEIHLNSEILKAEILVFKGRRKKNNYLVCIARFGADSTVVYRPFEIEGYRISEDYFKAHQSASEKFFIKELKTGFINLYNKIPIPADGRDLYYLKFPDNNDYVVLDPFLDKFTMQQIPNNDSEGSTNSNKMMVKYNLQGLKFKVFVSQYMGNCEKVTNMVKSEFYTINDVPSIVDAYNSCMQ